MAIDLNQLIDELETLPSECIQEIIAFVGYLKHRHQVKMSEPMILSESALAKDWDTPDEDEAWADL